MAVLKQRLHQKNSTGTYDTVHWETEAGLVLMADGSTVQSTLGNHVVNKNNPHGVTAAQIGAVSWKAHDTGITIDNMKDANYPYAYETQVSDGLQLGLPAGWWHIKFFRHADNNGFGAQLAIGLTNGNQIYYRTSNGTAWHTWSSLDAGALLRLNAGFGNEYVWERYKYGYRILISPAIDDTIYATSGGGYSYTFTYAPSINPDTGTLLNPTTASTNLYDMAVINNLKGMYWTGGAENPSAGYFYTSPSANIRLNNVSGVGNQTYIPRQRVATYKIKNNRTYVNSPSSTAYPVSDGYNYDACGPIGSKCNIMLTEYIGTNTYGSNAPNTIVCPFSPKIAIVQHLPTASEGNSANGAFTYTYSQYGVYHQNGFVWVDGQTISYVNGGSQYYTLFITKNDNTLSWYATGNAPQQNESTKVYSVIIIG